MTRIVVQRASASGDADSRQEESREGSSSASDGENTGASEDTSEHARLESAAPFDFRGLNLPPMVVQARREALPSEVTAELPKDPLQLDEKAAGEKKLEAGLPVGVARGAASKSAPSSSQASSSQVPAEGVPSKQGVAPSGKKASPEERRKGKEPKGPGSIKTKRSSSRSPASSQGSSPRSRQGEASEESGYNSADEQLRARGGLPYDPEHEELRERQFILEMKRKKGLDMQRILGDGNCLFRAMAHQVYGDAEMHNDVRQLCVDYMETNRDHYSQFATENFSAYCKRKRRDKVYGNNLEIQALSEMYNRPIQVYSYGTEPMNIFHASYETDNPPIRLSYHRGNHYNSLVDPRNSAVGVGLGFAHLRGRATDGEKVKQAIKAQQDAQLDKAVLAEGEWLSDLELTEAELERSVREASRAEALANWGGGTSTSQAAAKQRQPGKRSDAEGGGKAGKDAASTSVRLLLNMGFDYMRVMEASSLFGDDFDNMLCFLLEPGGGAEGGGVGQHKGKAALS